ncbi:hypothetical protein B0H13DRAFT_1887580 [Mycena leptocephala]|nr:hypothetical protein B0H13DRAFT_1887580 [Mycena leptocephala]
MPELNSLPTPTPLTQVNADMSLTGPWNDVFVIEWLRGIIKARAPAAAATSFSLTSNKYHRLPEIMNAIIHFNYFIQLHGSQPIPNVTLEMHRMEGPFERCDPSDDILHDKAAEMKPGETFGFTICNGSLYDLFAYLFYFDPAECTIQWNFVTSSAHRESSSLGRSENNHMTAAIHVESARGTLYAISEGVHSATQNTNMLGDEAIKVRDKSRQLRAHSSDTQGSGSFKYIDLDNAELGRSNESKQ